MMNLKLKARLLRAKSVLNRVADISFSYSQLEKEYRTSQIEDVEMAKELLETYNQLIKDLSAVIKLYEAENEGLDKTSS